jgi:hypothetical protein
MRCILVFVYIERTSMNKVEFNNFANLSLKSHFSLVTCIFGSTVTRIILTKLILAKLNFKIKCFIFGDIHAKMS